MAGAETLTEQQKKWRASVRANLEKNTGKSLAEWVEIAKTCPATTPKKRQQWFKQEHGLLQNSAMFVFAELNGPSAGHFADAPALRSALWANPAQRAIFEAVEAKMQAAPGLVVGQRKGYSAWSRAYQFAAIKPVKGGARLGLAVSPDADPRLTPYKPSDGWSERLKAAMVLTSTADVDAARSLPCSKAAWGAQLVIPAFAERSYIPQRDSAISCSTAGRS